MPIFEVTHDSLVPLQETAFANHGLRERGDLQRLLRERVHIIAPDVMVISEEFCDWEDSKRRVDLLGIDRDANLVVIELKRTEDGGHMELQAVRYAAMVSKMTFDKGVEVLARHLAAQDRAESAREELLNFLGWDSPDGGKFGQEVRIVLASAEFSRELTTAVLWLNERGLDIRCVRLKPYTDGNRVFVDVQQVLPLPEATDYLVSLREKQEEERQSRRREHSWSGLWFVNIGMERPTDAVADQNGRRNHRHWDNCVEYQYLSAGGGRRYSDALKRLEIGAQVLAYQRGTGYLGYGIVTQLAQPLHDFKLSDDTSLEEKLNLSGLNASLAEDDWEYAVGVQWKKWFTLSNAKTFKGVFANQNVVCKLSDPTTVTFLRTAFEIPEASD